MKGGVFRRQLVTYIIIMILIIGLLSVLMSQYLKVYFFNNKQEELTNTGRQVETQLIRYRRGDITREELEKQINLIGKVTNSRVIIVDGRSSAAAAANTGLDDELETILKRVLDGEKVVRRQQYASELSTYVVVVGIPTGSANTRGAVLLFSPVYEVDQALGRVYEIILITAGMALAVGLILVWVTSRRISRPVIELSRMAEQIARGEAVADAPGMADDEIGHLTHSFNHMKNRLAETDRMRREFIAGVSHELRTPLTSVRGFIQGILDGVICAEDREKYLRMAFDETNRLTRLTNDLLDLTKLEAGVIKLNKQKIELYELIDDSILTVCRSSGKDILDSRVTVTPEKLSLQADPDRLKQVLINLLSNACRYTPDGGRIEVAAELAGSKVRILVKDNGIGIPAAELPFIFEKFYRVDKSRNSSAGGSGLGLSIVKDLVELHGGSITARSAAGQGTVFEIILPRGEFPDSF